MGRDLVVGDVEASKHLVPVEATAKSDQARVLKQDASDIKVLKEHGLL